MVIQGIQFARRGPTISHLMYVDDTILFFEANINSCNTMKLLLDHFCDISCQAINYTKSSMIFSPNTPRWLQERMSSILGFAIKDTIGKYLGVRLNEGRNNTQVNKELLEKVNNKLNGQKAKLLSKLGRLALINSVSKSILAYQSSTYQLPKKLALQMDATNTDFFWGFKGQNIRIHMLNKYCLQTPNNFRVSKCED